MSSDSPRASVAHAQTPFFSSHIVSSILAWLFLSMAPCSEAATQQTETSQLRSSIACAPVFGDGRVFEYCPDWQDLEAYEFQLRLEMSRFSNEASRQHSARALFEEFLTVSNGAVVSQSLDYEESLFYETSWLLTELDGTPLSTDCIAAPRYRTSSYVRTREERDVLEDGTLDDDDVKFKAALKVRGIDPVNFDKPKDVRDDMECDVYADLHRATFKGKAQKLDESVSFDTFGAVLDLFPWATEFFCLESSLQLPRRDEYYTHRFKWKNVFLYDAEMECSLDLRMREVEGVEGVPYTGEFSCTVEVDDIVDARQNVRQTLDSIKHLFTRMQLTSSWVQSESFVTP